MGCLEDCYSHKIWDNKTRIKIGDEKIVTHTRKGSERETCPTGMSNNKDKEIQIADDVSSRLKQMSMMNYDKDKKAWR